MNKNIFRSRTVIGAVCILLAVLVCFGITPLFNEGLKAQTEAVRVKAEVIPQGTYITADMVEVYTRGASGMEDSNLFAERTNGRLYKRLVEPYIMGERRL